MEIIKNERGIGTGNTRNPTEPQPDAQGRLPPLGSPNPIASDPSDPAGKTPGAAESGGGEEQPRSDPGKTPGKAEG